ncbi:MAG TPA: hypothetical protein VK176_01180 [Phycisphaerales bacterium]|nr:hypothetical protein [Phycisphaerales bacterium]
MDTLPPLTAHDRDVLTRLLTLDEDFQALSRESGAPLLDLYAWAAQPHIQHYLAFHRAHADHLAHAAAQRALTSVLTSAAPAEARRAATTLLARTPNARAAHAPPYTHPRARTPAPTPTPTPTPTRAPARAPDPHPAPSLAFPATGQELDHLQGVLPADRLADLTRLLSAASSSPAATLHAHAGARKSPTKRTPTNPDLAPRLRSPPGGRVTLPSGATCPDLTSG